MEIRNWNEHRESSATTFLLINLSISKKFPPTTGQKSGEIIAGAEVTISQLVDFRLYNSYNIKVDQCSTYQFTQLANTASNQKFIYL